MVRISIAAIRNAAKVLKSQGKPVTISALAAALDVRCVDVRPYLLEVRGLADEIGLVQQVPLWQKYEPISMRYRDAYALLTLSNIRVTVPRLAVLSGVRQNAAVMWLLRHQDETAFWSVVDMRVHRDELLATRVIWLKRQSNPSMRKLTLLLGIKGKRLRRRARKNEQVREALKV